MPAGRPKKVIDEKQVEALAGINCSYEEMAAVLDCDERTLSRNFAQAIKKGRALHKMSLKRKQHEQAMAGNVTMLIWLGKQHLGQTDKVESQTDGTQRIIIERDGIPSTTAYPTSGAAEDTQ